MKRVASRRSTGNSLYLVETINAFLSIVQSAETAAPKLDEIAEAINADDTSDPAPTSAISLWAGDGTSRGPTFDEIAALLGELFAMQLPTARKRVSFLSTQHPHESTDELVKRVKRQAITDLGRDTAGDGQDQPLLEKVARLAMEIALLRGIEPQSKLAFNDLGKKILTRAESALNVQSMADEKFEAVAGFLGVFAKKFQPMLFGALFHAMSGAKPKPGPAREAYKFVRSVIWRARFDPSVGDVAGAHLGAALVRAVNGGTARLLVRFVDKSLPVLKG